MIEDLRNLQAELKALKKSVSDVKTAQVAKISIRNKAEDLGSRWFSELSEQLINENGLSPDVIEKYSRHFGSLIKISSPKNLSVMSLLFHYRLSQKKKQKRRYYQISLKIYHFLRKMSIFKKQLSALVITTTELPLC